MLSHRERDKKKPCIVRCRAFQVLVRLAGIEPTTPWFVAKYSIQLSYSRTKIASLAQLLPRPFGERQSLRKSSRAAISSALTKGAVGAGGLGLSAPKSCD